MINLQIYDSLPDFSDSDALIRAAERALKAITGSADVDLSLVLGDEDQLQGLNRQFRGIDAPTDVLSFPDGEIDPDSGRPYLGDVIISLPRAQAQATAGGHPLEDELQLLVVHGVLHLLGHDHAESEQKAHMWELQARILTALGCRARPVE